MFPRGASSADGSQVARARVGRALAVSAGAAALLASALAVPAVAGGDKGHKKSHLCGAITEYPKCGVKSKGSHGKHKHGHGHGGKGKGGKDKPADKPDGPQATESKHEHYYNRPGPSMQLYYVPSTITSQDNVDLHTAVCDGNTGNRDTARYVDEVGIDKPANTGIIARDGGRAVGYTHDAEFILTCEDDRFPNHKF